MTTEEQRPIDPQKALRAIWEAAPIYAKAKAQRVYIEQFRKSKKALLVQQAPQGTILDREAFAYGHHEYIALLDALKIAVEEEENSRWRLVAAEAAVEVWRSLEASNRMMDKSAR